MPDEHQQQINLSGEALLTAVNSLTHIAKIHSDNNNLLIEAVKNFKVVIENALGKDTEISIQIHNGRFYFQEEKLLLRHSNSRLFNRMMRFLENRNIYGLRFNPDVLDVAPKEIILFARLFDRAIHQDDPFEWLNTQFEKHELDWIAINHSVQTSLSDTHLKPAEISQPEELEFKKREVKKSYSHVLSSIKEVARKLSSSQSVGMRKSVRLVQKMVDLITEDESLFLGISTIRIYDDYTYVHSLNVAILSMCLGKRIGLTHDTLERLGLCGLFHDLGKVEIPRNIVNKKGALNETEYAELKNHSMHSARLILKLKAERDRKVRILVPPFEHHMGYDHSGYPNVGKRRQLSLFGRILTIADVYDAITSPRIYRSNAMSPDKALGKMLTESGKHFDPILLKVFINMLGVYPVGTLLKFDTGEMGIVTRSIDGSDRNRPIVQLLIEKGSKNYAKGDIADLREKNSKTGIYKRNITESLHPSVIGIQAAEYVL